MPELYGSATCYVLVKWTDESGQINAGVRSLVLWDIWLFLLIRCYWEIIAQHSQLLGWNIAPCGKDDPSMEYISMLNTILSAVKRLKHQKLESMLYEFIYLRDQKFSTYHPGKQGFGFMGIKMELQVIVVHHCGFTVVQWNHNDAFWDETFLSFISTIKTH